MSKWFGLIDTRPKFILDIGHSETSRGCFNQEYDLFEWEWNEKLADGILKMYNNSKYVTKKTEQPLTELFLLTKHYRDKDKQGYNKLANQINKSNSDYCISLHANAFNLKATGSEVWYQPSCPKSLNLARFCLNSVVSAMGLADRGVKECHHDDRGGSFLNSLKMPSVLVEPFFLDNDTDTTTAFLKLPQLEEAYIKAILNFLGYNLGEVIQCA
jgi:N-acetylmuramoyl-L-alanine amidase